MTRMDYSKSLSQHIIEKTGVVSDATTIKTAITSGGLIEKIGVVAGVTTIKTEKKTDDTGSSESIELSSDSELVEAAIAVGGLILATCIGIKIIKGS